MIKKVRMNETFSMLDNRRKGVLKRIARTGPFMMASPVYVKVKCGNPRCKCARDKKARHEKLHLSWMDAEGSGTQYVPVGLRKEVLEWVENYWMVKEHMKEMTDLSRRMIQGYTRSRRKSPKNPRKR